MKRRVLVGGAAAGMVLVGAVVVFFGLRGSAANSILVEGCDDPAVGDDCWIIRGSFENAADALSAVVEADSEDQPLPLPGTIDTTDLDCDLFEAGPDRADLPLFCTAALRDANGAKTHYVLVSHPYVAEQFEDLGEGRAIDGFYVEIREVPAQG